MQNLQHNIGPDLSKRTIDLFCNSHLQIENNNNGFNQMMKWLKQQNINSSEIMIVMEHTGLYSYCFEKFLHNQHISFSKVPASSFKHSFGIARFKSDKIDAKRLAEYGDEKRKKIIITPQTTEELQRLERLQATRHRMVRHKTALLNALEEYLNIGLSERDLVMQSQRRMIKYFEKEIEKLEKEIDTIITGNPAIKQNQTLLESIKGVGKVLSVATIIKTKNFTCFPTARKFACFCGTAPFPHKSGTSIKGKTKVDHHADKHMKTLLDLSAKTAIQYDKELKEYYLRRTAACKSKMSTINIVRNKILYRMFAVIKRQTPIVANQIQAI